MALSFPFKDVGVGIICGIMVKVLDCGILVSEFELQLRYYVHFHTNSLQGGCVVAYVQDF